MQKLIKVVFALTFCQIHISQVALSIMFFDIAMLKSYCFACHH